jgi:hypothetical protein
MSWMIAFSAVAIPFCCAAIGILIWATLLPHRGGEMAATWLYWTAGISGVCGAVLTAILVHWVDLESSRLIQSIMKGSTR